MLDLLAFKVTDVPTKNLIKNGDFSKGLENWVSSGSATTLSSEYKVNVNSAKKSGTGTVSQKLDVGLQDKIYASVWFKRVVENTGSTVRLFLSTTAIDLPNNVTDWSRFSLISDGAVDFSVGRWVAENGEYLIDGALAINLTKTFGAGNEPTAEQMDMLLSQFPNGWFDGTKNLFSGKEIIKQLVNIESKKANKQQEEWIAPTLVNGWTVPFQDRKVGYYKDSLGTVRLKGLVQGGATNTVILVLPVGYRPLNAIEYAKDAISGKQLWIRNNGEIELRDSPGTFTSLDGISFRAER